MKFLPRAVYLPDFSMLLLFSLFSMCFSFNAFAYFTGMVALSLEASQLIDKGPNSKWLEHFAHLLSYLIE